MDASVKRRLSTILDSPAEARAVVFMPSTLPRAAAHIIAHSGETESPGRVIRGTTAWN